MTPRRKKKTPFSVRCGIYTRVSTPDQAEGEFTSIDNQREMAEMFIKSQATKHWKVVEERFDDAGYSAATVHRPALQRLLHQIETQQVDVVLVYRLDRLSRSLSDFTRLMDQLRDCGVAFVSVTESFSTETAVGRLTMGLLATFAEFERATIAQRTSDKMATARKKGRWTGGIPVLGYDVHPDGGKLVINEEEAAMVKTTFALYLRYASLIDVANELQRRAWLTKAHTTKDGKQWGGKAWSKTRVHYLLTNPLYVGRVRYKGEEFPGEHDGIIPQTTWRKVQKLLAENRRNGGAKARNRHGFLLRGLLRCSTCGASYSPTTTTRRGSKVYRYYVCSSAQKLGWKTCPAPSLNAEKIELFVADQIREIGQNPALVDETLKQVKKARRAKVPELKKERVRLEKQLAQKSSEIRNLVDTLASGATTGPSINDRLAELEAHVGTVQLRLTEIEQQLTTIKNQTINKSDLIQALGLFEPIWDVLFPPEKERIIQLLIDRIDHDAKAGKLSIEFSPLGIRMLALEAEEAAMSPSA